MATDRATTSRLMLMMFLQFFIWGAWWTTVGNYMRSHGMTDLIYVAYMSCPAGSIVAPFLLGSLADRFFPVQKVLGTMHLLSAACLLVAPFLAENAASPVLFNIALFAHMLCYMPTVGLATATAFHMLQEKEREFPRVRMLGTIGWIVAGILVSKLLKSDTTALPMYVSAGAGLLLGFYAFTLPHVPPRGADKKFSVRDVFGIDALKELGSRPFYIFLGGVLLISIPAGTYFPYVPVFLRDAGLAAPDVPFRMTFGEMSEIFFLLTLPWFLLRWGIKGVLLAGMSAWILRYGLFSAGAVDTTMWMLILGICLHGPCYDFVFVGGQIYIDKKASPAIRAQAQGLFVLMSYGIGRLFGTFAGGQIFERVVTDPGGPAALQQWQTFWLFPLAFALVAAAMFLVGFRDEVEAVRARPYGALDTSEGALQSRGPETRSR
jgi:nucleoside transporter